MAVPPDDDRPLTLRDLASTREVIEANVRAGFAELRGELREGLAQVRAEMAEGFGQVARLIATQSRVQLGALVLVAVTVLAAEFGGR